MDTAMAIEKLSPAIREFGATITVLFVLLTFFLSLVGWIVVKQGKLLSDIDKNLEVHHANSLEATREAKAISSAVQSFRDSEKDIVTNLREQLVVHAADCAKGAARVCEVQKDIDAIGLLLEKLMAETEMRKKVQQEQGQDVSLLSRTMATLVTEGAAHQKLCDAMAKDVDAIGKSMGMLTAILTMKRRSNGDDSNGEK